MVPILAQKGIYKIKETEISRLHLSDNVEILEWLKREKKLQTNAKMATLLVANKCWKALKWFAEQPDVIPFDPNSLSPGVFKCDSIETLQALLDRGSLVWSQEATEILCEAKLVDVFQWVVKNGLPFDHQKTLVLLKEMRNIPMIKIMVEAKQCDWNLKSDGAVFTSNSFDVVLAALDAGLVELDTNDLVMRAGKHPHFRVFRKVLWDKKIVTKENFFEVVKETAFLENFYSDLTDMEKRELVLLALHKGTAKQALVFLKEFFANLIYQSQKDEMIPWMGSFLESIASSFQHGENLAQQIEKFLDVKRKDRNASRPQLRTKYTSIATSYQREVEEEFSMIGEKLLVSLAHLRPEIEMLTAAEIKTTVFESIGEEATLSDSKPL